MDKNYRIHTNIAADTILNVNMQQDYDFLEVLTMKLRQKDAYKLHSSNYGVIIGRVLANDAFGIPNAKISVFIERDTNDSVDMENIYPYSEVTSKDKDGRRYNLLPDYSNDDCYRIVGTFPNKRLLLDNDIQLEIYDKYWKYTTVTNNAGDYMIFGVPSGNQQIHVDIDLSDIGILSQKPRDFEYKGYNVTMFDNPNQFKESTNLESLAQLFSQEKSVFVYPFWGDADNGIAAITRADIQIQYKFEPTCVFMGSIVSDNEGNSIGHKCAPDINNGMNDQLIAGEGTIEMIRKTQDGLVEEFQIQGNQLIDSDGVWCYQIPMNLDFIGTDEYGNIVPTDDPNKGIPTRTQVRFRISKHDTGEEGFSTHTAKYLVPMNPIFSEKDKILSDEATNDNSIYASENKLDGVKPVIEAKGREIENMYNFGSNTPQSCFRDLYWNNVYSVKNYIPKTQVAYRPYAKNYSALKGSNLAGDKNPIPFNNLRVDLPFLYVIICIIADIISAVVWVINWIICLIINGVVIEIINTIIEAVNAILGWIPADLFPGISTIGYVACVRLGNGLSDSEIFAPGCTCGDGRDAMDNPDGLEVNPETDALKNLVVEKLAEDFKIIKLDLYQDWVNGCLYMPLWYWRKRKKKTFLFGLFTRSAKNQFCDCNEHYSQLKTYVTCSVKYKDDSMTVNDYEGQLFPRDTDWHRKKTARKYYLNGLIKGVENKDGLTAYYYAAVQATDDNKNPELSMVNRTEPFYAFRLYATDIILLGNLNEENLYGIPQFFKILPSTTANIPPIATINETEKLSPEDEAKQREKEEEREEKRKEARDNYDPDDPDQISTEAYADMDDGTETSGVSITTGMNWRSNHQDQGEPAYANGLFMELACTEVYTKAKSCFNVERMSELGVNNDMQYYMAYSNNKNIIYGQIKPDGLISKLELDDMENRAMFATMNHIGFVPQEYQDTISGYTTQVEDENTNYLVPKFRYIYPVDFDGRMRVMMEEFKKDVEGDFKQHMFDETDQSYLTFRFGADASAKQEETFIGEYNRKRHFYHHNEKIENPQGDEDYYYEMPLYNNSYFFYFGVNKGSTAIDKFNKLFYSDCFKNNKAPFTYNIETRGKSYCPNIYNDKYMYMSYGHISFKSDDIQTPLSYTLYDSLNNVVISESNLNLSEFTIGARFEDDGLTYNKYGAITYQNKRNDKWYAICSGETGNYEDCEYNEESQTNNYVTLENRTYILEITDANGRILSEEINLSAPETSFDYDVRSLGAKYYDETLTPKTYICDSENQYYGIIRITTIYIDGITFTITNASIITHNNQQYVVEVSATSSNKIYEGKTVKVVFYLTTPENECMCENIGENSFIFDESKGYFEFAVYKPMTYIVSVFLKCNEEEVEESEYVTNINVSNGENFDATLNKMPIKFMLGKNDSSNFYSTNTPTTPVDTSLIGWYGLHDESKYKFSDFPTTYENTVVWGNYLTIEDITSVEDRRKIVKYKFDKMFNLSNCAYITNTSSNEMKFYAYGGTPPTMTRVFYPNYRNIEDSGNDKWVLEWLYRDNGFANNSKRIPNIVGGNFDNRRSLDRDTNYEPGENKPTFNAMFEIVSSYTGNYFAAYTNNGRYTGKTTGDCSITIMQIPNKAAVNVDREVGWKPTNQDLSYDYNYLRYSSIFTKLTNSSTDAACTNRATLPHFRAMFVDRKLDYDLVVWTPTPVTIKLYPDDSKNNFLNNTRISGCTYNGIEMIYDEEYNIISSNGNNLEYSYEISNDSHTTYHKGNTSTTSTPTNKRFYEAIINNNADIRQYFWSNLNKNYMDAKSNEQNIYAHPNDMFFFKHTNDTSLYNGEFSETNYPTKRLVDIGNIEGSSKFSISLVSCSYNMTSKINDDVISCKTTQGDKVTLNMSYRNSIYMVKDESEGDEFCHVRFYTGNENEIPMNTPHSYSASSCTVRFRYSPSKRPNFAVYPRTFRLIKVLDTEMFNEKDGTKMTDALTYIKTTSSYINGTNGLLDKGGNNDWYHTTNDGRMDEATMERFDSEGLFVSTVGGDVGPWTGYEGYYHNNKKMQGGDSNFNYLIFEKKLSRNDLRLVKAISILSPMDYYGNDVYHINHIKTIESTEIFDLRKTEMSWSANTASDGPNNEFIFTIKQNNDAATTSLDMFNQLLTNECEYYCLFKNDNISYNDQCQITTTTDFSVENYIKIIAKFGNQHHAFPGSFDEWAVYLYITTPSNFIYLFKEKLKWINNKWVMSDID